jgi:light-regulated signal transduction histidine kinase (bacteriophytochrome)
LKDFELTRCEDEPIHIPGAVQGFGVLIAVHEDPETENLVVRVVSENSGLVLGLSPQYLFSLNSFTDLLSQDQENTLRDHISFCRVEQQEPHDLDGPEVFLITGKSQDDRKEWTCWCAMHIVAHTDLIVLEFELEDDDLFPLIAPSDQQPGKGGMDVEPYEPTEEDLMESTTKESKPLRLLNRRQQRNKSPMEHFSILSQVNEQLASATDIKQFVKIVVGVFKEITGFHRVMVYQFDEEWNGQVVAELVDWSATKDLYRGLHFPATDIPAQARELYTINKVRLLYDRDQPSARLVCQTEEDLERPLDMTHSYLRAISPIHIKYLANMGVRASMSISIVAFKELWGLISCHSYGNRGMRISFVLRKLCRLVGETVSRNIERLSLAQRLHSRKLINTSPTEKNPGGYIVTRAEDLLSLFDADFGVLSIGDEGKILGPVENSQEVMAALQYLRLKRLTTIQTSQNLRRDYPDMVYLLLN